MASLVVGLPWLRIWVFPELHPPFSRPGLPLDSPEKSLRLGFLRHWSPGGRGARPFRSVADRESARRRREDGAIQLPVCQDATELLKDGIDLVTYRQGSSEFVVLSSALYSSQC
nr:PREDICTED: uncharacterized protein LOC103971021 [Musa acuminata subsp. malaccensis]